jgi:hypothetical protein
MQRRKFITLIGGAAVPMTGAIQYEDIPPLEWRAVAVRSERPRACRRWRTAQNSRRDVRYWQLPDISTAAPMSAGGKADISQMPFCPP